LRSVDFRFFLWEARVHTITHTSVEHVRVVVGRCLDVGIGLSVFGIFVRIFYVGSVFSILKYRDMVSVFCHYIQFLV